MNAIVSRASILSCAALVSIFAARRRARAELFDGASAGRQRERRSQLGSQQRKRARLGDASGATSRRPMGAIGPVSVVRDRPVCAKLATQFDHEIASSASLVVLRIGPLFYAREPDQKRGTGIITDSTYKVILRLGASVSSPLD